MARPKEVAGRSRSYMIALVAVLVICAALLSSLALLRSERRRPASSRRESANDDAVEDEDGEAAPQRVSNAGGQAPLPAVRAEVDDVTTSRFIPATLQSLLRTNRDVRRTGGPMHRGNCREDLPGCCPRNPKVRDVCGCLRPSCAYMPSLSMAMGATRPAAPFGPAQHVLFFHSQKTGGSSVAEWLLANGKANGMRVMDKVEALKTNDYFCACR